jgi:hypothetical protein
MAWKAKRSSSFDSVRSAAAWAGFRIPGGFSTAFERSVFLAIADVAHPRFSAKLQSVRMSRRNVFLVSGATFRLVRKLSRFSVLICAMVWNGEIEFAARELDALNADFRARGCEN